MAKWQSNRLYDESQALEKEIWGMHAALVTALKRGTSRQRAAGDGSQHERQKMQDEGWGAGGRGDAPTANDDSRGFMSGRASQN